MLQVRHSVGCVSQNRDTGTRRAGQRAPVMATFWHAPHAPHVSGGGHARARVLVVDDERDVRAFLGAALRDDGYDVREAADGTEAVALLGRWAGWAGWAGWRPDVVLVDLLMAPGTGWAFVHAYRRRWGARAALLAMTAAGPAALRSAAALDVDEVLPKPLDVPGLLELVAAHVRQRRALRRPGSPSSASRAS